MAHFRYFCGRIFRCIFRRSHFLHLRRLWSLKVSKREVLGATFDAIENRLNLRRFLEGVKSVPLGGTVRDFLDFWCPIGSWRGSILAKKGIFLEVCFFDAFRGPRVIGVGGISGPPGVLDLAKCSKLADISKHVLSTLSLPLAGGGVFMGFANAADPSFFFNFSRGPGIC